MRTQEYWRSVRNLRHVTLQQAVSRQGAVGRNILDTQNVTQRRKDCVAAGDVMVVGQTYTAVRISSDGHNVRCGEMLDALLSAGSVDDDLQVHGGCRLSL
jgi:hypothetical protein